MPWQVECDSKSARGTFKKMPWAYFGSKSAQGIFHPPQNVFQFRGTKLPRQFRAAVLGDETAAAVSGRQFRGMKLPRQFRAAVSWDESAAAVLTKLPRQFHAAVSWDETAAAVSGGSFAAAVSGGIFVG